MSSIDLEELKSLIQNPRDKRKASHEVAAPEFELDDDGETYMPVGTKGVLAASQKLLAINRGLAEPDERDSLKFQKVYRVNSMLREGIKMDAGKTARTVMYRAAKRKNLQGMDPGVFNPYVDRILKGNPLTAPLEEINPMHLVENARRISRMGPGGLRSSESITEDAQSVHPSQFGFLSTTEGPECVLDNQWIRTKDGAVKIDKVDVDDEIYTRVGCEVIYEKPLHVYHESYTGVIYHIHNKDVDLEVTPNHRMIVRVQGETDWRILSASAVYGSNCHLPGEDRGDVEVEATDWTRYYYNGKVHCVTVPHHVICLSPDRERWVWTGNSERAGIDVRAAWGTKLGSDGRIYQKFLDRKTGRYRWMSPADLDGLTVKLPD